MKNFFIIIFLTILGLCFYYDYNPFTNHFSPTKKDDVAQSKKIKSTNTTGPKTAEEYFDRGNIKSRNKNYKSAISDYTKAIKLNPNYVKAFEARALMKDKLNDFNGAEQDYNTAIEIKSNENIENTRNAYKNLKKQIEKGNTKVSLQDYVGAIEDYTVAIDLYPQYQDAYICRADVRCVLKDYQGALLDYNKAIRMFSNSELYYKRANVEYNLNDYQSAIEDYKLSIKLDANYEETYYKLFGALILSERFEEALDTLRKFMTMTVNPYIYVKDFHDWNNTLNKCQQNQVVRNIKSNIRNLKLI